MRAIAVMNQKGGVGKTTTAVNLSAALAERGARVGLIDLDPQAHASLHLAVDPPTAASIYHVLIGQTSLAAAWRPARQNLQLVPSSIDLAGAELEMASLERRESVLRQRVAESRPELDYLLIDCPPSLGLLTINALVAVEEVFIPLQPHFLALHGLGKLLETIQHVAARFNRRLHLGGVVLCMYDANTRLASEVSQDVERFFESASRQGAPWGGGRVFKTRIRRNIRLAEAPSFGKSIFEYAGGSHGADDYRQLAAEVVESARRG